MTDAHVGGLAVALVVAGQCEEGDQADDAHGHAAEADAAHGGGDVPGRELRRQSEKRSEVQVRHHA